jgi:hypothetical protein
MPRTPFITTLIDANVSHATAGMTLPALGLLLWSIPTALYSYGLYHAITDGEHEPVPKVLWALIVGLHTLTGLLVYVDARWYSGHYWPLQTFVIGLALFNTLSLPALSSYYMSRNDRVGTGVALGSLGFVCLSDASMVAILFELFHRRLHTAVEIDPTATAPPLPIRTLEASRAAYRR